MRQTLSDTVCPFVTGADLGALLSEAQLAAAHEVVASHVASGGGREGEANFSMPVITGAHLSVRHRSGWTHKYTDPVHVIYM